MAIPSIPNATQADPVQPRGAVREPSAFDRATRVAGRVAGAVESQVNQRLGFNVRDEIAGIKDAIGGKAAAPEKVIEQVAGKVGGLLPSAFSGATPAPQWGKLSSHLLARMYPCDSKGVEILGVTGSDSIYGPITDANFELTLNWQSPFESSGPESKAPALMALVQTGQIATIANALQAFVPGDNVASGVLGDAADKARSYAKELEGRTGITKLNSRQVFSGMPPIKLTMTMHLRALSNPQAEVMEPYQKLLEWALPQELADDGILPELMKAAKSGEDVVKALFPSLAPHLVGFNYGNNRYSPMVIESVSNPIDGPMDANGLPIYRAVQLTLATLTALDKNDVGKIFSRGL